MRGVKNPPLPGEGDPESQATYRTRYLAWLAERNFSAETIESRGRDLYAFIVWAAERGLNEPREITRPILERYQRHLYQWKKDDGAPLSFRTQGGRLARIRGFFRWLAKERFILANPAEARGVLDKAMRVINPAREPDDEIDPELLAAAFAIGLKGAGL